eukprot:7897538-Lingulodinium_polyedra.AAC.1
MRLAAQPRTTAWPRRAPASAEVKEFTEFVATLRSTWFVAVAIVCDCDCDYNRACDCDCDFLASKAFFDACHAQSLRL